MSAAVLYLDYDGVLHDEDVRWSRARGIFMANPGRVLFEWAPILDNVLIPYPEVAIVLSTSWVREFSFGFAKKQLPPGLQARVIGATYHRREMRKEWFASLSRGEQVLRDVARRQPQRWLAIDDDATGWPVEVMNQVILTDGNWGLSDLGTKQALEHRLREQSEGGHRAPHSLPIDCHGRDFPEGKGGGVGMCYAAPIK